MSKINLDLKVIGSRLKEARKAVAKKQKEVAKLAGLPSSTISEMETGVRRPHAKYMLLLVSEFNINLNWIFTGKGSMFADFEISWDFGKDNETLKEMLYLVDNSHEMRAAILKSFFELKRKNKEIIESIVSEMKEGKPDR